MLSFLPEELLADNSCQEMRDIFFSVVATGKTSKPLKLNSYPCYVNKGLNKKKNKT